MSEHDPRTPISPDGQSWWDGDTWRPRGQERPRPPVEVAVDLDHTQRAEALNAEIARRVASKWTVETRSDHQAVMSYGSTTDHSFHLILTVLTAFFWLPVWALVWGAIHVLNISSRDMVTISIDEQGQCHET